MNEYKKKNFFMRQTILVRILLVLSILLILVGISFIIYAHKPEVLNEKYIITDVTERVFDGKVSLGKGEIRAIKSTDYIGEGIYKLTFSNYSNPIDNGSILEKGSYFSIIDIIGDGYIIDANDVVVNGKHYKFNNQVINADNGILIEYNNGALYIDIPANLISDTNVIEVNLILKGRKEFVEYITTDDAYFNFIPSMDNDFYKKKMSQSYMMDGYGYIILKEK